jgi:amino acid adenylation domain-containing protein/FkbM family methyltransferase
VVALTLLHQLIEEQATRTPEATAVVFEQESLTYAELDRRAEVLAGHLCERGVGPDVLVGLFVERSVDMIVGILGILKAGGAYLPIDATHPTERVAFLLRDANVTTVLTHSPLLPQLPPGSVTPICLDSFDYDGPRGRAKGVSATPDNLAYVIYTSGSTGRPKGVCIEHRNIVNYVVGVAVRFGFEPGMQHATVSTIAADLGNTVVFPSLATGGCLHVISQARAESQLLLSEYFSREQIDVLKIVPSHLAALQTGRHPERVMPRRRLILGGEASRPDWVRRLRTLRPGCEIYNHYGPTETTVGVLTHHIAADATYESVSVPLGKPLPNNHIHILDPDGMSVAVGEAGELCVSGDGVARGYLNRPELTAARFVPAPVNTDGQTTRMYRTGDRARRLPDGNVEFLGRLDDQIKLHGNRIEPAEIEGVLRESSGVRDAVVLPREDESGDKRLIAYIVPERQQQPLWDRAAVHALPDGSTVAHLNRNETDYIYNEIFVLQAYLRHGITVRDGDCIVDAGANIGLFSVFMSRLASNLRIFSFEPNPVAFACLQANAAAWGDDVTCLPVGLSHEEKSAELTSFGGLSLLSGFYADAATEREVVRTYVLNQQTDSPDADDRMEADIADIIDERLQSTTVAARLTTLSRVIAERQLDRIDLLKINVEKSELDVLLGLAETDWPKIRQMVIEVDTAQSLQPIADLLSLHGFDVLVEQDELLTRTDLCYVYAIRHSAAGRLVPDQGPYDHIRELRPRPREILTPATLRADLKERLPHYMIPSAFVLMEKLPLTSNGKIDRQTLASFSSEPMQAAPRAFVAPRTETEKTLADIWSDLLQVPTVGVTDDFFEVGGQSLTAIKAVSRIRDAFGVDVSLRHVFAQPTLGALAEIIDGLSWVSKPQTPADSENREELSL